MNRRSFFTKLASGIIIAAAPQIFIPKFDRIVWKIPRKLTWQELLLNPKQREAFAAYIGPVIKQVLNQTSTASMFYSDYEDDNYPSIPLYYGNFPISRKGCIIF